MPSADTRIAIYWLVAALGFGYLGWIALYRLFANHTRARLAIATFAVAWTLSALVSALLRIGWATQHDYLWREDARIEVIRWLSAVSTFWLCVEFRAGRIGNGSTEVWNGEERRKDIRRQADREGMG